MVRKKLSSVFSFVFCLLYFLLPHNIFLKNSPGLYADSVVEWNLTNINECPEVIDACKNSSRFAKKPIFYGYSTQYSDYNTPMEFANIRFFDSPHCKKNTILAGASPWYAYNGRALAVNKIAEKLNVGCEVNLECDENGLNYFGENYINFEKMKNSFPDYYFLKLKQDKKFVSAAMPGERDDLAYGRGIVKALLGILKYWRENGQGKPVYIHCLEGRFRTGDVLSVLHLLMGDTIKYARTKFLISFRNYFSGTQNLTKPYLINSEDKAFEYFLESLGIKARGNLRALFFAKTSEERIEIVKDYLVMNGMDESEVDELINFLKVNKNETGSKV